MADLEKLLAYDPSTGIFTWKEERGRGPSKAEVGDKAGSINDAGYRLICVDRVQYRAHRLAYEFVYGAIPEGLEIDHINGLRDDNRIENLRTATRQQNSANARKAKNNSSGQKGVYRHSNGRFWVASIMVSQRPMYLGLFKSLEDARAAYCSAAKKHFGDYARAG